MFNYKMAFTKKMNTEIIADDIIFEMINDYWNALSKNGQVIGGFDVYTNNGNIFLTLVLPTEDSLSDKNNDEYVTESFKKLTDLFDVQLIFEGINIEYHQSCICDKPSWYYLYQAPFQNESPLICADCSRPVPLFKVPYIFKEREHHTLLNWQVAYNSMCNLWCYGLWDRFTYGEQSKYNSKLNREGRKISKELEKVLRAPVYYYLFYLDDGDNDGTTLIPHGLQNGTPKSCPRCGSAWTQNNEFCKCEKCRLITNSPD